MTTTDGGTKTTILRDHPDPYKRQAECLRCDINPRGWDGYTDLCEPCVRILRGQGKIPGKPSDEPKQPQPVNAADSIDATLAERGKRYGVFADHAEITQQLKCCMVVHGRNWGDLKSDQKEALEMIAHKIGRILNGDPDFHDHWHDIQGYAKLVADRLQPARKGKSV